MPTQSKKIKIKKPLKTCLFLKGPFPLSPLHGPFPFLFSFSSIHGPRKKTESKEETNMTPLFPPYRPCTGTGEHGAWYCQEMMGEIAPPPTNPGTGERQYCVPVQGKN